MSYKDIPGRPGWQFRDNPKDPGGDQSDLWQKQNAGIRKFGKTQVYTETKKSTDPYGTNRGEISATFYNKEVKDSDFFSSLNVSSNMPDLLLDFVNEVYRVEDTTKTFDDAVTFTRSGNATMVGSDGLIKWAPHNLIVGIESFSTTPYWSYVTGQADPFGGTLAYEITQVASGSADVVGSGSIATEGQYTLRGFFKPDPAVTWIRVVFGTFSQAVWINSTTGAIGQNNFNIQTTVDIRTDGWIEIQATQTLSSSGLFGMYHAIADGSGGEPNSVSQLYGLRLYRSDLGGMVDNPDANDSDPSFVLTTDSARYLARRGHHVYNGTSWVKNEGLLLESEARTNSVIESDPDQNGAWFGTGMVSSFSSEETNYLGINAYLWITQDNGATNVYARLNGPSPTVTVGNTYTFSVYLKAGLTDRINLLVSNTNRAVDLTNKTGNDLTYESVGNGWYRVSTAFTPTSSPMVLRIGCGDAPLTLDGTDSFYVAGVQLEEAPTPSSYIPTNGATVTRAGETIEVAAADIPFTATGFSYQQTYTQPYWEIANTTTRIILAGTNAGNIAVTSRPTSVTLAQFSNPIDGPPASVVFEDGPDYSLAFRMNFTEGQLATNGVSDPTPAPLTAGIGDTVTSVSPLFGLYSNGNHPMTAKKVAAWGGDIGTAGIEEVTDVI